MGFDKVHERLQGRRGGEEGVKEGVDADGEVGVASDGDSGAAGIANTCEAGVKSQRWGCVGLVGVEWWIADVNGGEWGTLFPW